MLSEWREWDRNSNLVFLPWKKQQQRSRTKSVRSRFYGFFYYWYSSHCLLLCYLTNLGWREADAVELASVCADGQRILFWTNAYRGNFLKRMTGVSVHRNLQIRGKQVLVLIHTDAQPHRELQTIHVQSVRISILQNCTLEYTSHAISISYILIIQVHRYPLRALVLELE